MSWQASAQESETLLSPVPTLGNVDNTSVDERGTVLMKGPVHEAFAEQYSEKPIFGLLVPIRPPEMIDEVPPDTKPAGDQIIWIGGYWGWEEEARDFVWVTGLWRQVPPGRRWVPGYWNQVESGYQWVSGFWADARLEEIEYLPTPPPPVEASASIPSPGENYFYIPGKWIFRDQQYQWQAGFWAASNPDWIWIPDCYVWTPGGCVHRSGYWDYQLANRGTLFCPMQFQEIQSGFRFQPRYVISTGVNWLANLFVYPAYRHYYFGDYYATSFRQQRIHPWNSYSQAYSQFDPFHTFYTINRPNDLRQVNQLHQQFDRDPTMRPLRTMKEHTSGNSSAQGQSLSLQAADIATLPGKTKEFRKSGWDIPTDFEQVGNEFAARTGSNLEHSHQLQKNRSDVETHRNKKLESPNSVANFEKTPNVRLRLPKANQQLSETRRTQSVAPSQRGQPMESRQVLRPNLDQSGGPRVNGANNNLPPSFAPRQSPPQPQLQNKLSPSIQSMPSQPPIQVRPNSQPKPNLPDRNANGKPPSNEKVQRAPSVNKNPIPQSRPETPRNRPEKGSPNRGEGKGRDKPK